MSARDELAAAVAELGALPMPTGDTGPALAPDREQTIRTLDLLPLMSDTVAPVISGHLAVLLAEVDRLRAENGRWRERTEEAEVGEAQLKGRLRGLRARVAELEALKPARFQDCQACGTGYEYGKPCSFCEFKKRIAAEIAKAQAEDPHDSPLHHTYAEGRDLPEVTP